MAHEDLVPVHSLLLEQYGDALKKFDHLPGAVAGLQESVVRLNQTLLRINERLDQAQSKEACDNVHDALNILRLEQLGQVKTDISTAQQQLIKQESKHRDIETELAEIRGAMRFLKWAIPIAIAAAPGISTIIMHLYAKH